MDKNKKNRYQRALEDWDERTGLAREQVRNWRTAALMAMLVSFILLLALVYASRQKKQMVYVARIAPGNVLQEIVPITEHYTPDKATQSAFIGQFIRDITTLPLDPIVFRDQWLRAYAVTDGSGRAALNRFARHNDPGVFLGKRTRVVKITSFHPLSNNSQEFSWQITSFDRAGKILGQHKYNGLFTLAFDKLPSLPSAILNNPLGIKVVYLNINKED
jgi:type IV secretory pathway TrbF-like protein